MWAATLLMALMTFVSLFLILLILLQRGRGGGLAGALGGMGGQSAFGTKAGDLFTRVTVVTAVIWFLLGFGSIWAVSMTGSKFTGGTNVIGEEIRKAPGSSTDDAKEFGLEGDMKGDDEKLDLPPSPATSSGTAPKEEAKSDDGAMPAKTDSEAAKKPVEEPKPAETAKPVDAEKKSDAPKPAESTPDAPKTESPKVETPKPESPKVDAPKPDAPKEDAPKTDADAKPANP